MCDLNFNILTCDQNITSLTCDHNITSLMYNQNITSLMCNQNITFNVLSKYEQSTVVPTKSDSDVIQLLSKTLKCTLHLSYRESIDHLCFNPILHIGLIQK